MFLNEYFCEACGPTDIFAGLAVQRTFLRDLRLNECFLTLAQRIFLTCDAQPCTTARWQSLDTESLILNTKKVRVKFLHPSIVMPRVIIVKFQNHHMVMISQAQITTLV
jgi:hypothetical protein